MRGWISIDQDQSERMINSFSSLTEMFCLAIGQSSVDLSNARNSARYDECKTFSSGIRRLFLILLCLIKCHEEYFAIISHSFTIWDVVGSTERSPRSNDWNDDRRDYIYPTKISGCCGTSLETNNRCSKISHHWILHHSTAFHCGTSLETNDHCSKISQRWIL